VSAVPLLVLTILVAIFSGKILELRGKVRRVTVSRKEFSSLRSLFKRARSNSNEDPEDGASIPRLSAIEEKQVRHEHLKIPEPRSYGTTRNLSPESSISNNIKKRGSPLSPEVADSTPPCHSAQKLNTHKDDVGQQFVSTRVSLSQSAGRAIDNERVLRKSESDEEEFVSCSEQGSDRDEQEKKADELRDLLREFGHKEEEIRNILDKHPRRDMAKGKKVAVDSAAKPPWIKVLYS
jgi:hypothetical protein